jgi:hypothetical protein
MGYVLSLGWIEDEDWNGMRIRIWRIGIRNVIPVLTLNQVWTCTKRYIAYGLVWLVWSVLLYCTTVYMNLVARTLAVRTWWLSDMIFAAGSDASSECAANQFACSVGGPCLPLAFLCNGVGDCPNGDDEARCGKHLRG